MYLDKIFLFPRKLWRDIFSEIKRSSREKGFYLIGFNWVSKSRIIIYDAIEFNYTNASETYIESNPNQKVLLYLSLPAGLNLLGILHSHPFEKGTPRFSSIDMKNFEESYEEGLFIVVSADGAYNALFKTFDTIYNVELKIVDFEQYYEPKCYRLGRWNLIVPNGFSKRELEFYSPFYISEIMNKEIGMIRIEWINDYAKIILPKFYDVVREESLYKLPYRIYYKSDESLRKNIKLLFNEYKIKDIDESRRLIKIVR